MIIDMNHPDHSRYVVVDDQNRQINNVVSVDLHTLEYTIIEDQLPTGRKVSVHKAAKISRDPFKFKITITEKTDQS